jgi:hypothetical protein
MMNPFMTSGMGMGASFGGASPMPGMGVGLPRAQQVDPSSMMMEQLMASMAMAMMGVLSAGSMSSLMGGRSPRFGGLGNGAGGPGLSSFLGGGHPGAGRGRAHRGRTGGGSASTGGTAATSGSGGAKAVQIAKKYLGRRSGEINDMKNFTHAGGASNNCADFVSACLADAGTYKKKPGDASVATLKQHLQQQGWKKVSKAQAQAGDVAIFNGSQHVELVAAKGAKQLIGSNNQGRSYQTVGMDSGTWGSVEYFAKR